MIKNESNISKIEDCIFEILIGMGQELYFGTIPTKADKLQSFVLVDCGNAISNLNAYSNGVVLVYLYARPLNEEKNSRLLSQMETLLDSCLEAQSIKGFAASVQWKEADYDEQRNMHCVVVVLNVLNF